jgi:hypothetical protein
MTFPEPDAIYARDRNLLAAIDVGTPTPILPHQIERNLQITAGTPLAVVDFPHRREPGGILSLMSGNQ